LIIILFLLVFAAVFIGMYNLYGRQKNQIKHLFRHIDPLLQQYVEEVQQHLAQQNPSDADQLNRLNELVWRLKSRNNGISERVSLYNRIGDIVLHGSITPEQPEQLALAIDAYNSAVKEYNAMLSKFPTYIIAALFNHHKMKLFEVK
jgi:hypothetical protein